MRSGPKVAARMNGCEIVPKFKCADNCLLNSCAQTPCVSRARIRRGLGLYAPSEVAGGGIGSIVAGATLQGFYKWFDPVVKSKRGFKARNVIEVPKPEAMDEWLQILGPKLSPTQAEPKVHCFVEKSIVWLTGYTVNVAKWTAAFWLMLYTSAQNVMTKGIHGFQISPREDIKWSSGSCGLR